MNLKIDSWRLNRDITLEEREKLYILAEAAGLRVWKRYSSEHRHRFASVCSINDGRYNIVACTTRVERGIVYTYNEVMEELQRMIRNNPYVYED